MLCSNSNIDAAPEYRFEIFLSFFPLLSTSTKEANFDTLDCEVPVDEVPSLASSNSVSRVNCKAFKNCSSGTRSLSSSCNDIIASLMSSSLCRVSQTPNDFSTILRARSNFPIPLSTRFIAKAYEGVN